VPFNFDINGLELYAEWRRYWNVSKPVLLEKSPRHIAMTRLLQHWFTADRSKFVIVLRHPLGTMQDLWRNKDKGRFTFYDCGMRAMEHWLLLHEMMLEDIPYIKHRVVFHFERFIKGDSQGKLS
jgi:hypothetical protein